MPPESWCGYCSQPALAVGDADELQQFERARPRLCLVHPQMDEQRLLDLLADLHDRIERGHRLLEDHGNVAAAYLAHLLVRKGKQVTALEQHAAPGDAAGRLGEEAHDGERGHRFAATGFAHDGDDLAALDGV